MMICQLCKTRCHADGPKQVHIQDSGSGQLRQAQCPACICHDCVQISDDPVRRQIAPLVLGQTVDGGGGRPGLFSIQDAISKIDPRLALKPIDPDRRRLESRLCWCGSPGRTRCIACSVPICSACEDGNVHHCSPERGR